MRVSGWGRYLWADAKISLPRSPTDCLKEGANFPVIPRGAGRSYGDSANQSSIIQSTHLNHFLEFDAHTGVLICQAGLSIREILNLVVPKGWFFPVTPGTSYVTLGGAIASDVHGKNHHLEGAFSECVQSFRIAIGSGEILEASLTLNDDLFKATCGGMGLTGIILDATIQLRRINSNRIVQTTIIAKNLDAVCDEFERNEGSTYSVAWIDCLAKGKSFGRSVLMLGEHEDQGPLDFDLKKPANGPAYLASKCLNKFSIQAFNALYYQKAKIQGQKKICTLGSFFYPLDAIANWNQFYGNTGFFQYQFVIPKNVGRDGLRKLLNLIVESGKGSFLAVLKCFGKGNANYLSFPIEGYTLALDFKVTPGAIKLIHRLDELVVNMGGRVYLTKDALMLESVFKASYSGWQTFEEVRSKYGAFGKFSSHQSKRLGLQ